MNDLMSELAAEAEAAPRDEKGEKDTYAELVECGNEYDSLTTQMKEAEELYEKLKKQRLELQMKKMVELFQSLPNLGKTEIGNWKFALGLYVNARVPKDAELRRFTFNWLENNQLGGIIKSVVTLELPAEDHEQAQMVVDFLKFMFEDSEVEWEKTVPWKRYETTMKQVYLDHQALPALDAEGKPKEELPLDKLGVTVGEYVEVRRA